MYSSTLCAGHLVSGLLNINTERGINGKEEDKPGVVE